MHITSFHEIYKILLLIHFFEMDSNTIVMASEEIPVKGSEWFLKVSLHHWPTVWYVFNAYGLSTMSEGATVYAIAIAEGISKHLNIPFYCCIVYCCF